MNVRARLTLIFSAIVIILLGGVSTTIYFFSAGYRQDSFYQRLKSKAVNTAKLLIKFEEVNADLLRRIERDNPINLPNERIRIFNYLNVELYSSGTGNLLDVSQEELDRIRLEGEISFKRGTFEALGFLYTDGFERFAVVAAAEDIHGLGKLKNLRNILLLTFGISMVLVPISGWIYVGRMLSPISTLVNQTEEISASRLDRRLKARNATDEFGKLTETINFMLSRLELAFVAQKQFISNASHELRTPLTSITGEIQVTLAQSREKEKYEQVLNSVLEEVKGMSHLSNQLLLLAQASADLPNQARTSNRIDEMIWQLKDEIARSKPNYTIEIDMDTLLDEDSLTVSGDEQLLKTAFLNLIDNGCKYSSTHTVKIRLMGHYGAIKVEFENHGVGIDQNELDIVFQPFYRGMNARSIRGHGIGLSLVQRIVTSLHKGDIHVTSLDGLTIVSVILPHA